MLDIPVIASSNASRIAFCYRVLERLRLWHNEQGALVRVGALKDNDFRVWVNRVWEPKHKLVCLSLHSLGSFTQAVPTEWALATKKHSALESLTSIEQSALDHMANRNAAKIAAKKDTSVDVYIDPEKIPSLEEALLAGDPMEDYTTYSVSNPNGHLSVAASKITFTNAADWTDANRVYLDKGVGFFDANFTHTLESKLTSGNGDLWNYASWMLANALGQWYYDLQYNDLLNYVLGYYSVGGGVFQTINEYPGGYSDGDYAGSLDNLYYVTVKRDEAVGTYGTLYGYTYTDAAKTNLLSSQALALHNKINFRYIYGLNAGGQWGGVYTGFVQNLDLGVPSYGAIFKRYHSAAWQKTKLDVAQGGVFGVKRFKVYLNGSWKWVDATEDSG